MESDNRQVRFKYDGTWTRWFNENEDLSFLRELKIQAMEITEYMTYDKAMEYLKELENI